MRSARVLRSLRACGSVMTWLVLATSPARSLGFRFPLSHPTAPFAPPTLASHQHMAAGMHGRVEYDSSKRVQAISCPTDNALLHASRLSSEEYPDTACGHAASGAGSGTSAESSHGDRVAAVDKATSMKEAAPRSTHNGAGLKTSHKPSVPIGGRSTRGRTKALALLRPSQGPTRGRRLCSCCMQEGDTELDEPTLKLPERPFAARFLLSRSDAGTLIVTLPPPGIRPPSIFRGGAIIPSESRLDITFPDIVLLLGVLTLGAPLLLFGLFLLDWVSGSIFSHLAGVVLLPFQSFLTTPGVPSAETLLSYALFGGVAPWLAARAFTTATLSVGEFQWEYKETVAGMSLIPTCYMQGRTEEFEVYSLTDGSMFMVTGLKKVEVARHIVGALSEDELRWVVSSVQSYQSQIREGSRRTRPSPRRN